MGYIRTETRITGPGSGGDYLSVQHWSGVDTEDPGELLAQATEARDRIEAAWLQIVNAMVTGSTVYPADRAILVSSTPPGLIPLGAPTPLPGNQVEEALPWVVQGIITLRTGEATRHGYGRIFIPYLTEFSNVDGRPGPGTIDSLNAFADALVAPQGITPLNLVVYNRTTGTGFNVGTAQARDYWAYLSSRRD